MSSPQHDDPYLVLGLSHDATDVQINKAWRRKTRSMGPSDPEFAAINDAAALLLNPEVRRAYDAEHAVATEAGPALAEVEEGPKPATKPRRSLSGWNGTILFAGVMATIAVGLAIWQGVNYADKSDTGTKSGKTPGAAANAFAGPSSAQTAALSAAQQAIPVVLGYDYRSMNAGMANANRFLSAAQRQKFAVTMQRIIDGGTVPGTTEKLAPVAQRQAVVTATVISIGIISANATSAQVGAFIKQVTNQKGQGPLTHQNWVQIGMINEGGAWLVNGICVPSAGMTCTATGQ